MLHQFKRVGHAATLVTKLAGLITASVLASGCSLLPFGHSEPPKETVALRPQMHETVPNAEPDCIAAIEPTAEELATPTTGIETPASEEGCSKCACKSEGAAVTSVTPNLSESSNAIAIGADEELQRLMDGNKRFVEGESENVYNLPPRPGLAAGKTPRAMIVACADWDIQPESAFDTQLGDLFVVRVVGSSKTAISDAVEYAVNRFDIPLILVVGHESCGVAGKRDRHAQAARQIAWIRESDPAIGSRIAMGKLMVAGAFYDESNGQITLEAESKPEIAVAPHQ